MRSSPAAQIRTVNDSMWKKVHAWTLSVLTWGFLCRLTAAAILLGLDVALVAWAIPQMRARSHLCAARVEMQHYHTPQAIRHLRLCREIWPRDPEVLLLAARAARRASVYGDSERLLSLYFEVKGRDEEYTFEQLLLTAECNQDQVVDQCWQYVEENRFDVPLLLEALTRGYLRLYRVGMARRCLDYWRQLQPDNPQMYYLEGLLNFDYLHAMSAAVESYRHAVELDADHEEARLGLAVSLLTSRNYTEATKHFERLMQVQPENARVQVGLAECRDGLGETAEALRLLDDVLARHPGFPSALSLRGQLALRNGQLNEAEAWLRQALLRDPKDHRACHDLVLCLEQTGQDEKAREQKRLLQQMEQDVARFNEIVSKELPLRPNDPALHCALGQLLLRTGQREGGLRWLQSALQLDTHYPPARQALAEYLRQGKVESRSDSP
jgi:tetratricopeptide (TPR) repeat protein